MPSKHKTQKVEMPLSERQRRFAQNLVQGMSQVEAYRKAGYTDNVNAAMARASALLRKANVAVYIAELREKSQKSTLLSIEEKRAYLADLLRLPADKLVDAQNGNVTIPDGIGKFIQGIDVQEKITETGDTFGFTKRIRLADKLRALELDNKLAGHDAPQQLVVDAGPSLLEWIRQRNGQSA